jgi:DNA topoisomerase VI subunit B
LTADRGGRPAPAAAKVNSDGTPDSSPPPPRQAVARTTFVTSRLLEFASVRELVAQIGTTPDDWPLMIIREAVDNALDACEEAGVSPVIRVIVGDNRIRVTDNGPGIPPETVASILDFATRTSSREAYVSPDRGRQGNALKTLLAVPLALSGSESRVEIVARGVDHDIRFKIDRIAQQPEIEHRQDTVSVRTGTSVTVHWPESACSQLAAVWRQFLPLAARYTDLNPHLEIRAAWVDGDPDRRLRWRCPASDPAWQKWTPSAPTCPHWYGVSELERLAAAFMAHDRKHKSVRLLRDFLAEFNGLSGTGKRKEVLEALDLQRAPLERLLVDGDFDHDLAGKLLQFMQWYTRPVKHDRLGAIGKVNVARALHGYGGDLETFRYKLIKGTDDGVPWIAEAAFAYRSERQDARRLLIAGLNWAPALDVDADPFDLGYVLASRYCVDDAPIVVLAHLICPRPQFLDRGETSLARHSPGFMAVREAVENVVADWAKQRRAEIQDQSKEARRLEKLRTAQPRKVPLKNLAIKHLPAVIEGTSHGHTLSFTQRDLFYAMRPLIKAEHDKPLEYNYFCALLTDYENERGEISGLQREARGSIYHPHIREEIPLSTASVAGYQRPFWTFNKLVYIEKAGTQKNLIELAWAEEHDCAIASVAGFTTRAIKDLIDMLSTSPEAITVFCVHDADAAGTMIYETLQRETKAGGARKIEVVNLGLEPWQGVELGLDVEPVELSERRRPVAAYVTEYDLPWQVWLDAKGFETWADWLQKYRIELNAMPPADRVEWLTGKIEAHPPRKVIPPDHVLDQARVGAARDEIYEELERRAGLEERTEEIVRGLVWPVPRTRLPRIAERYLDRKPFRRRRWRAPMAESGRKVARRVLETLDDEG